MPNELHAFWKCLACSAINDAAQATCEVCAHGRPTTPDRPSTNGRAAIVTARTCARCGEESNGTNTFHADGAPEDRGRRLCPSCWIPALKRRVALDPPSPAFVAECLATIRAYASRYPSARIGEDT